MKKTQLAIGLFSIALLASCTKDVQPAEEILALQEQETFFEKLNPPPGSFVPGELIVKFKKGKSQTFKQNAFARISGTAVERIITNAMKNVGDDEGIYLVKSSMGVKDAISTMRGMDDVEYAEPNYIYTHDAVSNDTYFTNGNLWGMYGSTSSPANQYGSQAAVAWAAGRTGSNSVYVGIIDEGYMYTHTDLNENAGTTGDIAGNGKDDDGNGYVDDVYGWDFDGNNNSIFDGTADDHGTHVAGTIGGVGGNGTGVAGVCWNVKLLGAKFLGSRGGTTANAVKAVDYFTGLKNKGLNIVATNNSWGGGGASQALHDAIKRAGEAGILFIAAAGNNSSNNDNTASYPSNYNLDNVIAVASITSSGALSSFSNYGATKVHIGAPGSSIVSTVPSGRGKTVNPGYASYSRTSMATPHVTGAVALYKSVNPGATAAQIKNAILSSAVATPSLSGKTSTGGRLNAFTALSK